MRKYVFVSSLALSLGIAAPTGQPGSTESPALCDRVAVPISDKSIERYYAKGTPLEGERVTEYNDIDVDGDDTSEKVTVSSGSAGSFVESQMSGGGRIELETGFARLLKLDGRLYVLVTYWDSSRKRRKPLGHELYSISSSGADLICGVDDLQAREREAPGTREWLLGRWIAQGRGTVAVHGDMEIHQDKIFWEHHGLVEYQVVSGTDAYVLVELERKVGCGSVYRFEPDRSIIEGAVALHTREYSSLERATLRPGDPRVGSCASGWYLKESSKQGQKGLAQARVYIQALHPQLSELLGGRNSSENDVKTGAHRRSGVGLGLKRDDSQRKRKLNGPSQ